MGEIPWKYRPETASPVYSDRGGEWVGWIRIERWRTNIADGVIGEEVEHVELNPREMAEASGSQVIVIQMLMSSMRWQLELLRSMCKHAEPKIRKTMEDRR